MDFKTWNQDIIKEFRENRGQVAAFAGKPLVIVHNRGAKSGAPRLNPLMYLQENGRTVLFASMGGAPRHPDWYYNLKAHPEVQLEFPDRVVEAVAKEVTGPERDRLYAQQAERFPQFAEYQESTDRTIPVMVLDPK